jgi:hypothetical protein
VTAREWNPEPKTLEQRRIVEVLAQHPTLATRGEAADR